LEPEELGEKILPLLASRTSNQGKISIHNEINALNSVDQEKRYSNVEAAQRVVEEAFAWLVTTGLLVPEASSNGSWCRVSRRGRRLLESGSFASLTAARLLSKDLLHVSIREQAWRAFLRGEYDVAVFQSMKAVEVTLREVSGLGDQLVGVKLARAAFGEGGPLADPGAEGGERQARSDLFAGALGSYKNPQSHRHVALDDPLEAVEQIVFASHLLRVLDGCRLATTA
jgi:uncharacterized protein (TIGR02391 family)